MKRQNPIVRAPWTQEQIDALNSYQRSGIFHAYTCGGGHGVSQPLWATTYGWECPLGCGYSQDWAHGWIMHLKVEHES